MSAVKKRTPLLWRAVRTLILGYLLVLVLAFFFQRSHMIYFPTTEDPFLDSRSASLGLVDVELEAADGVSLKAWYWPGESPVTLVIFHGNAGHRGNRLGWLTTLRETGAGLFILDYRGFGGSDGSPSEEGLYLDGLAAIEWLEVRGEKDLVYVGESLGAAIAVEMAIRRPPRGLILQSAFTSLKDMARYQFPFIPGASLVLRDHYESIKKIPRVTCPVLVIHGEEDSLVPPAMGRALYQQAPGPREWLSIPRGGHNDPLWLMEPTYTTRLKSFLNRKN